MKYNKLLLLFIILFQSYTSAEESLMWFENIVQKKKYNENVVRKLKALDKKDCIKALDILSEAKHAGVKLETFDYLAKTADNYKKETVAPVAWKYVSFDNYVSNISVLKFLIKYNADGVAEKSLDLYHSSGTEREKLEYMLFIIQNKLNGWINTFENFLKIKKLKTESLGMAIMSIPDVTREDALLKLTELVIPFVDNKEPWGKGKHRICDLAASRLASLYPMFTLVLSEEDRQLIYGDYKDKDIWNNKLKNWLDKNKNKYEDLYKEYLSSGVHKLIKSGNRKDYLNVSFVFDKLLDHYFQIKGNIQYPKRMDMIKKEVSSWWEKTSGKDIKEIISSSEDVNNLIREKVRNIPVKKITKEEKLRRFAIESKWNRIKDYEKKLKKAAPCANKNETQT